MNINTEIILSQERVASAQAGGYWNERILLDYFHGNLQRNPHAMVIVGRNSMTGRDCRLTNADLQQRVRCIAAGLLRHGIEPGDVISAQLPNWWEVIALHLAALHVGAAFNPLMPMFRERELAFMLGLAQSKLIVVPEEFRGCAHARMLGALQSELPDLRHVLVVGAQGEGSFDRLIDEDPGAVDTLAVQARAAPGDVIELLYTSGSTGEPKGVMHTSNTLMANLTQHMRSWNFGTEDVTLMSSPLAHQTGFLYGIMNPIMSGGSVVLQDIWNAREAVGLIEREGVTFSIGATPFLIDLLDAAEERPHALRTLRNYVAGGAPIPPSLVRRSTDNFKVGICCMWGMTENGPVAYTRPEDAPSRTLETDGSAAPGMEMRIMDESGRVCPVDTEGRLMIRGPGLFVGYLKRPQWHSTDAEGWFDTGDLARMDTDGFIRITGRTKDVIIRGGENIPVVEVESLIYLHPAIAEAAIVGMPDPRLNERACAFVVLRPGHTLDFDELRQHLLAQRCAKAYLPERLEIVAAMPHTPSGKIQKFKLREQARAFGVVIKETS